MPKPAVRKKSDDHKQKIVIDTDIIGNSTILWDYLRFFITLRTTYRSSTCVTFTRPKTALNSTYVMKGTATSCSRTSICNVLRNSR